MREPKPTMVCTTRRSIRSMTDSVLSNADNLGGVIASYLTCRDLANLSSTCSTIKSCVTETVLRLISSFDARYDGEETLSPLEELNFLRTPPEVPKTLEVGDSVNVLYKNGVSYPATILGDKYKGGVLGLEIHWWDTKAGSKDWVTPDQVKSHIPKSEEAAARKRKRGIDS